MIRPPGLLRIRSTCPKVACFEFEAHSIERDARHIASHSKQSGLRDDERMNGPEGLDPQQLGAYFAFTEAANLLQHQVEQHLRAEGDLSSVQFQLLARL